MQPTMTPAELKNYLDALLAHGDHDSVMIWGPPGIGKSSIVASVTQRRGIGLIDLRLSQLMPSDIRGLPTTVKAGSPSASTSWCPPDFLPRSGRGILFLDEFNMATPVMQGVTQQLILDRKVGNYRLPDGWSVWAAGNRREDKANTFDMSASVANRFLHLWVSPSLDSFTSYAIERGFPTQIIAFLNARPELLHKPDPAGMAWPSPRSWEAAGRLFKSGLPVHPAIGQAAELELMAFVGEQEKLPMVQRILKHDDPVESAPALPANRYAVCSALAIHAASAEQALRAFKWTKSNLGNEWTSRIVADLLDSMRTKGLETQFIQAGAKDTSFMDFLSRRQRLLGVA